MAVVLVHQGPSVTREKYEETVRRLTAGKTQLDSPADWPEEGSWRTLPETAPTASASSTYGNPRTPHGASATS